MFLGLFGLGLLITAGGIVTIGLGIPIKAFNLGNTLILSGTVAVVGGFIVIGLAAQIRQLNRLAEMITPAGRPSGGNRIRRSRCVSDRAHSRAAGAHRDAARSRHAESGRAAPGGCRDALRGCGREFRFTRLAALQVEDSQ